MDVEVTEETPPASDAPEVVDTSTTVVVPPASDTGSTDSLVALAAVVGAHEERLSTLEATVQHVAVVAETAEIVADSAADLAADTAVQVEEVAVEAETVAEVPNDEPPTKTHWAQRSWSEWRSGRQK